MLRARLTRTSSARDVRHTMRLERLYRPYVESPQSSNVQPEVLRNQGLANVVVVRQRQTVPATKRELRQLNVVRQRQTVAATERKLKTLNPVPLRRTRTSTRRDVRHLNLVRKRQTVAATEYEAQALNRPPPCRVLTQLCSSPSSPTTEAMTTQTHGCSQVLPIVEEGNPEAITILSQVVRCVRNMARNVYVNPTQIIRVIGNVFAEAFQRLSRTLPYAREVTPEASSNCPQEVLSEAVTIDACRSKSRVVPGDDEGSHEGRTTSLKERVRLRQEAAKRKNQQNIEKVAVKKRRVAFALEERKSKAVMRRSEKRAKARAVAEEVAAASEEEEEDPESVLLCREVARRTTARKFFRVSDAAAAQAKLLRDLQGED